MDKTKEHNQRLADELQAYHDRRCKESKAYARCIEQRKYMRKWMDDKFAKLQQAISKGVQMIECEKLICQKVRENIPRPEDISQQAKTLPEGIEKPNSIGEYAFLAWMFDTEEARRARQEEMEAWDEIHKIEEKYKRRMICAPTPSTSERCGRSFDCAQ